MRKGSYAGRRAAIVAGALAALTALLLTTAATAAPGKRQNVIIGYAGSDANARALVSKHGGAVNHAFPQINAIAASLDEANVGELRREAGVQYVENDAPRVANGLSALSNTQLVPSASNGLYGLVM